MIITESKSPIDIVDENDQGDKTQRNFRYQHAYGIILLVASAITKLPYKSIWCEQHEDILAEKLNSHFDAYQIKTRKVENGEWRIKHDKLKSSIKHFVGLQNIFGEKIDRYYFVSNCNFLDCSLSIKDQKKLANSPIKFLKAIQEAKSEVEIPEPFDKTFSYLLSEYGCEPVELFTFLRKMDLIIGPGRDSFDAEISHTHIPQIPKCEKLSPTELNNIRDEILYKIYGACSLKVEDPVKHYRSLIGSEQPDLKLLAKCVTVDDLRIIIDENSFFPFRFLPGTADMALGNGQNNLSVLKKKFVRGGLISQFETMKRRSISAEAHLIGLAHKFPDKIDIILNQIANVVKAECDEAFLESIVDEQTPAGVKMMIKVYRRLKDIVKNEPEKVENQTYECLVGVAGLLTGECEIWWSDKFDLESEI